MFFLISDARISGTRMVFYPRPTKEWFSQSTPSFSCYLNQGVYKHIWTGYRYNIFQMCWTATYKISNTNIKYSTCIICMLSVMLNVSERVQQYTSCSIFRNVIWVAHIAVDILCMTKLCSKPDFNRKRGDTNWTRNKIIMLYGIFLNAYASYILIICIYQLFRPARHSLVKFFYHFSIYTHYVKYNWWYTIWKRMHIGTNCDMVHVVRIQ